jgi:hypothetical protein
LKLKIKVIIVTVGFYGLVITPISRFLGISKTNPQGVLIVGAHTWARLIGKKLKSLGFEVILVDTNKRNIYFAKKDGLKAYKESVLQENIEEKINLDEIGKILCLTPNDEANALAALRFQDIFGMENVFQLPPELLEDETIDDYAPNHLRGRYLFGNDYNYKKIATMFASNVVLNELNIEENTDIGAVMQRDKSNFLPLFLAKEDQKLIMFTLDGPSEPVVGDKLIYLSK